MKIAAAALAVAASTALALSPARAQTPTGTGTGTIAGTLVNSRSGAPLQAEVTLFGYGGEDNGITIVAYRVNGKIPTTQTDSAGRFAFHNLPAGTFIVAVSTPHHSSRYIKVGRGRTATVGIRVPEGDSVDIGTMRVKP